VRRDTRVINFAGKRVAVIGTGATAVQAVPEIAKQAAHAWVFQRTPNYDIPGRNRPLEPGYAAEVKADYKDLWQKARESGFGLPYQIVERSAVDYSPAERQPIFEAAWAKGGFYMGLETFSDYLVNKASNDTVSEFVRDKIRGIVTDRAVAVGRGQHPGQAADAVSVRRRRGPVPRHLPGGRGEGLRRPGADPALK
jgi:cation diffusion facilitator CzcD-associated flavoprotein CzcO